MIFSTSDVARFVAKVSKSDGCWMWTAGIFKGGYGKFWYQGRSHYANRIALMMGGTAIPPGLFALHKCDNPSCVRHDHLFVGSASENTRDMFAKGRNFLAIGMLNGHSRNPFEEVQEARRMVAAGVVQRVVAAKFSVSFATVCNWCKGNKRKNS